MLKITFYPENNINFTCVVEAKRKREEMKKALRFAKLYNYKYEIQPCGVVKEVFELSKAS